MFNLHADPTVKDLKNFFYNEISGKVLTAGHIDEDNIDAELKIAIQLLIGEILTNSARLSDGFKFYEGFILHKGNCPLMYLSFYNALMTLKTQHPHSSVAINRLADALINTPGFAETLPKIKDFILGKIDSKKLKDFFYQKLNELAFLHEDINEHNVDAVLEDLVKVLIREILMLSRGKGSTILFGDEKINLGNCPRNYLDLYQTMAMLNQSGLALDSPIMNKHIDNLANTLVDSVAFKLMLPKVKQFILEIRVLPQEMQQLDVSSSSIPAPASSSARPAPVAQPVDISTIRHTFYQHMHDQLVNALENGLITIDDVESQEPFLYLGLPGLALLAAIDVSSNHVGGILLSNGAIVDKHNCPKEGAFRDFLNTLLLCKERVQSFYGRGNTTKLPDNDYKRIQHLCLGKNPPNDLVVHNEVSSTHCSSIINSVASKISQNADFQKMVSSVMENALHDYKSRHVSNHSTQ